MIQQGQIIQQEMKKNRVTLDELSEQLRKKEIVDISSVKYGILETDGTLSALLYTDQSPVTPMQMKLQTDDIGYPVIVINNGRTIDDNLRRMKLDGAWLTGQLKTRGIGRPDDVYLMTVDEAGRIYYSVRDGVQSV